MEAIPPEWVDNLFFCMENFYSDRWQASGYAKTIWQNGLAGLTHEQIKNALRLCKRAALSPQAKPPHVMEFFRFAKGDTAPHIYKDRDVEGKTTPGIATQALQEIRKRLAMR